MKKLFLVLLMLCLTCSIAFYGGHQLAYDHAIYNADAVLLGVFKTDVSYVIAFNTFMIEDKAKFFEHIYNQFRLWFEWNLPEVEEETVIHTTEEGV